jgi:hypothetical protein
MRRAAPRTRWLLAFAAYLLLSIVLTWPLAIHLGTVVPNDTGDPLLNSWILWWNAHHVPLTRAWWNARIFWPTEGAIALSEHLLGLSLIASPLQWLGADPVTAYCVVFLLSFPLSALAAHALGYTLTGRHDASFVAGLVFGFNPYRIAQVPHIQVLASWWLPLALVGLHQYLTRRETRWLWLYGGSWLLAGLSNGYYMLFFPVLIALWMFWFVPLVRDRGPWGTLLGVSFVASLPLLFIAWKYRQVHVALDLKRAYSEILYYSPDVMGFFDASPLLKFWHLTKYHKPEGELFPGLVAVLLIASLPVAGALQTLAGRYSKTTAALMGLAVVCLGAALWAVVHGPWSIAIGGHTLVSVAVVKKPISLGLAFLLVALICHPRVREAWRRRSAILFYALATVALYLLVLGPEPQFLGRPILYRTAPYEWLMLIPGFDTARAPSRFTMIALVALSAAASLAFARLTARRTRVARTAFAIIVCAGIAADGWIAQLPLPVRPPRIAALEALPAESLVLELPLGDTFHETAAMYRGMYHRHTLVNGFSGFEPPAYSFLRERLASGDAGRIDALASASPLIAVVDTKADESGRWSRILDGRDGVKPLAREGDFKIFSVGRTP